MTVAHTGFTLVGGVNEPRCFYVWRGGVVTANDFPMLHFMKMLGEHPLADFPIPCQDWCDFDSLERKGHFGRGMDDMKKLCTAFSRLEIGEGLNVAKCGIMNQPLPDISNLLVFLYKDYSSFGSIVME